MKKRKPLRKLSREVAADRLLRAVGRWVEACGGTALIAGGIGLIPPDPFGLKYNYSVVIGVTGKMPVKTATPADTEEP